MAAHKLNGTWELVECPPGMKPIANACVGCPKSNTTLMVPSDNTRPVLLHADFSRCSGIDYFETFTPTTELASLRVLAFIAALNLHLRLIDVSNVFLNRDINTNIYMEQPEGFVMGGRNIVYMLRKGLYGMNQGAHA